MKPQYHFDIKQNTPEWDKIRRGRVGGSSCQTLTTLPTRDEAKAGLVISKGARSLAQSIAADHLHYYDENDHHFMSDAMLAGHEYEPYAADAYALWTFQTVTECGYISLGDYLGYSPDRLVGDDGLLEIKCPGGKEFVRVAETGSIKKEYIDQMQFGLFVSGRQWCDHVTYNQFDESFIIHRFERDQDAMNRFEIATAALIEAVKTIIEVTLSNIIRNE